MNATEQVNYSSAEWRIYSPAKEMNFRAQNLFKSIRSLSGSARSRNIEVAPNIIASNLNYTD